MSTISPERTYRLNLDPKTQAALTEFSRRRRALLLLRAGAAGAAVLIGSMLLVTLCDYLWFLDDGIRWLLSLTGYVIAAATMWRQGLGELNDNDPRRLARRLETAEPRLREDLLSAVELADPNLANGSEGFLKRLQRRVGQRAAGIDIGRLLPVTLVRRWIVLSSVGVMVCLIALLIPQMQFARRIARAMFPGMAIQRASLTELKIIEPSPSSGVVAQGDAVAVIVQVSGRPVEAVRLRWRNDEGVEGETEMTERVTAQSFELDGAKQTDAAESDIHSGSPVQYAANLAIGSIPVEYQVTAGDAITLWNTLKPLPRPRAIAFDKRYSFPHYARLDDRTERTEHGDLQALLGTTVEVTVHYDQPVEEVHLRFANHGIKSPLQAVDGSAQVFRTSIPIKTPGQYQLDATSVVSGLNNPFSPQYTITPIIDAPPVARWSTTLSDTSLVSPLDVVTLTATASDDLPMDRMLQEFMVNSEPMVQRELATGDPARELELSWGWDLMQRDDDAAQHSKLAPGDVVRTRVVAIDRRGNRGESRWIEFLITDEGFDAQRHQPLEQLAELTSGVSKWVQQVREIAGQLKFASDSSEEDAPTMEDLRRAVEQLREDRDSVLKRFEGQLRNASELPQAATLELIARALLELELSVNESAQELILLNELSGPASTDQQQNRLRDIGRETNRFETDASRVEQLMRADFGQHLTLGVVSDGLALLRSLSPLRDRQNPISAGRFPRHLNLAAERMQAITDLIRQHESALPESTVRHYQSWERWSASWLDRFKAAIDQPASQQEFITLSEQFADELNRQLDQSMVDGRLVSTLNNMQREIQSQLGPASDRLRQIARDGAKMESTAAAALKADDSVAAAGQSRDLQLAQTDWDRGLASIRERLAEEETLHRARPRVDLQYAADLTLLDRAIENITSNGFKPYREEPAAEVHRKIADAFQLIEAKHRADAMRDELLTLLISERRLSSAAKAKIMHPWWLERYSVALEWPIRYLRNLSVPSEEIDPLDRSRYSEEYNQARSRITSRRWSQEELLTADPPLTTMEQQVSQALEQLEPRVAQARQVIQQYVLSLPELAREAAEQAEQARDRTDDRRDSSQDTAETLASQQQQAERSAEQTLERLVDVANTADITDPAERELARDADAAAMQIQDALEQAEQSMKTAVDANSDAARQDALEETEQRLDDLSRTLRQTSEHFERAQQGEQLADTRAALRQAEQQSETPGELQERYDRAEEIAEMAEQDPQELLEQLEQELQTNPPMQQELSEIAKRAAEAAQRTLQQAAKQEYALNQSLERADPTFQEQKRQIASEIADLANRVASVDQSVLDAAENAVGWGNQRRARPILNQARQQLRGAVQNAQQLDGENALLSEMQQIAGQMNDAIETASEAIERVNQMSQEAADEDIHQNDSARQQATTQLERFERDARNRAIQSATSQKRAWEANKLNAQRRARQSQKQKVDAEKASKRTEDRLKSEPTNADALQREIAQHQRRAAQAARAEQAAKRTESFANQQAEATNRRLQQVKQTKAGGLKRPNPAAELATRMTEQATERLAEIREQLDQLAERADIKDQLRVAEERTPALTNQQQRIRGDLRDANEQLQRAARHEQRLGRSELAETLEQTSQMIAESAENAAAQADEAIQQAGSDTSRSPQAGQKVADATEQIGRAAEKLAQWLADSQSVEPENAAGQPAAADQQRVTDQQSGDPSQSTADGRQMARTLDELDRALAASAASQPQSGAPGSQGDQAETNSGQAQAEPNGQPPGQPASGNAADASATLAEAVNDQSQQAARQRQQQFDPANAGNQPGNESRTAEAGDSPGRQPGPGEMPRGGRVDTSGTDRIGSDWGQLRERRTDDAAETPGARIAPQYRREIEAYFKAVARRAAGNP